MFSFIKQRIRRKLEDHTRRIIHEFAHDIEFEAQLGARRDALTFAAAHLRNARPFPEWTDLVRYCASEAPKSGLVCECGVYMGRSANLIAALIRPRTIHGFDSFEGLPESWRPGYEKTAFTLGRALPKVESNVALYPGWFDKSLPEFREDHADPLAFLHVDCDIYSSTKTVLDAFSTAIVPGTVILFDEFYNYPGWQDHEYKALLEWEQAQGRRYEYIGYASRGEQVALRVL